ncbi:MAG: isoprenylcysteine carboxylmethyltransferase family protein [Ferruginibacter sp.]
MIKQYVFLGASWLAYVIIHSILATTRVKSFASRALHISEGAYRRGYNVLAVATLLAIIYYQLLLKSVMLFNAPAWLTVMAACLFFAGIVVMAVCIYKYFRNLSGLLDQPNELIISGLHHVVRHPLYMGTFMMLLGLLGLFPYLGILIMVFIIITYTVIALRWEEDKLVKEFGKAYQEYKLKVPAIIPNFRRK